jgi:hypothetical protein
LAGEQPAMEVVIADHLTDNGYPDPLVNVTYAELDFMPICVAAVFLEENWEFLKPFFK